MGSINGKLSGRGTYIDTNNDGTVDGLVHTIKNAGNFNTFSISNGILTIQGPSGGSAVGGSSTHVQYNQGGALKGEAGFTYNETSNTLSVPNLTVSGELIVTTTTTLNSNTVTIGDSILVLNSDATGSASADAGIEIERGDDANVQLLWDESEDAWDFDGHHLYSIGSVQASGSGAVYTFTSDSNTGIEHVGADQLGLLTGGTRVLMVNINGVEIKPAGATGAGSNQALVVDNISIDTNTITSIDTDGDITIGADGNGHINLTPAGTGDVKINTDTVSITGAEGESATLQLISDESDDAGDDWSLTANTDNTFTIGNDIASAGTSVAHLTITPHATVASSTTAVAGHLTVAGDLTVSGSTTTVSSTNTHVADTLLTLNSGESGNGITGGSAGIEIDRGVNGGVENDHAKVVYDEASTAFQTLIGSNPASLITGVQSIISPNGGNTITIANSVTTNQTVRGLQLDLDATGITASGQTANYTGLVLSVNSDAPTQVGSVNNVGANISLTAGTSGTQSNTGLIVTVGGADTNYSALFNGGNVGIGTSTPTAELHVIAAGTGDNLILESSASNSTTSAPNLVLYRNASDAVDNNDLIGQIVFRGENTAGTPEPVNYVTIEAGIDDKTDGSEDGHLTINLIEAGTLTEFMRIRAATRDVVVNDQADDIDFRVESQNNQNMLFVDANEDRVGIGTDAPARTLHVLNSAAGETVQIESTDASGTYGPGLNLYRNSSSPDDDDNLGKITFSGRNDNTQDVSYAELTVLATDVSDNSEDGSFYLTTIVAGTSQQRFTVLPSEVVINENSLDSDFRVEGNSDANLLFADAGNDKVGIGVGIPKTKLTVEGSVTLKEQAAADTDTAAYGQLWVKTATPNQLYFTTDAGDDIQLTSGTSIAGGGGGGTVDVVSNVATSRILGRTTAGSGDSEELTAASVRTLLNVADGATAYADANAISAIQTAATLELAANATFTAKRSVVEDVTVNGVPTAATTLDLMEDQRGKVLTNSIASITSIGLPDPGASQIGDTYVVLNTHSSSVTIERGGGAHGTAQNLNGAATNGTLPANEAVTLIYIATNAWWGIGL